MSTMLDRFRSQFPAVEFEGLAGEPRIKGSVALDVILQFAESELFRALQPREPAPELAEAEMALRKNKCGLRAELNGLTHVDCEAIARELDRLRAEVERIRLANSHGLTLQLNKAIVERDEARAEVDRLAKENAKLSEAKSTAEHYRRVYDKEYARSCRLTDVFEGMASEECLNDEEPKRPCSEFLDPSDWCYVCIARAVLDGTLWGKQDESAEVAETATRTWYQCATTAEEAVDPEEGYGFHTAEDAESHLVEDEHVYRLTITATKEPTT